MANLTPIQENDLYRGLDANSAENAIPQGFVEGLTNVDPTPAGSLRKRTGFQRTAGYFPIRIHRATRSGTKLTLHLQGDISLAGCPVGPLLIYGKVHNLFGLSTSNIGPITTDPKAIWFDKYKIETDTSISVTTTASGATETANPDTGTTYDDKLILDCWAYGIPSDRLSSDGRENWVTSLTSYNTASVGTILASWRRNFFYASTSPAYGLTELTTFLHGIINSSNSFIIGRVFYDAAPTLTPSRGYIVSSDGGLGFVKVVSATYNSSTKRTTYRLYVPGYTPSGSLTSIIRPNIDRLQVDQLGWESLVGEFLITGVTHLTVSGEDYLDVETINDKNKAAQKSDTNAGGRAGIFTDSIPLSGGARFLAGDFLIHTNLEADTYEVVEGKNTSVIIRGVDEPVSINPNHTLSGKRTSKWVPLRNGLIRDVTYFLRGDVCTIGDNVDNIRVESVVTHDDVSITITGNGTTASISGADQTFYSVGDKLIIFEAGDELSGIHEITEISGSTIKFASSFVGTATGRLLGHGLFLGREVTYADDTGVSIAARFVPTESLSVDAQGLSTTSIGLYATEQLPVFQDFMETSAAASGVIYATNGEDPLQKFDGAYVFRAGLPRWQPLVSIDLLPNTAATIANPRPPVQASLTSSTTATVASEELLRRLTTGESIVVVEGSGYSRKLTRTKVKSLVSSGGTHTINFDTEVTSGSYPVSIVIYADYLVRYAFRLVATDLQGNRIVGNTSSSQDSTISIGPGGAVIIRLANLPRFDRYQYDRIEIEVLRTGLNDDGTATGAPPFYKLATIPLSYRTGPDSLLSDLPKYTSGYIEFVDSIQLQDTPLGGIDPYSSIFTGGDRIGEGIQGPPKSKLITTLGGRLICGNIVSEPSLSIQLLPAIGRGEMKATDLHQTKMIIRRNEASESITQPSNVLVFEFLNLQSITTYDVRVSPFAGKFLRVSGASLPSLSPGDWIYLTRILQDASKNVSQNSFEFTGYFQVIQTGSGYVDVVWQPKSAIQKISSTTYSGSIPTFNFASDHGYATGDPVLVSETSTDTGTNVNNQYYVIYISPTSIRLAKNLSDAIAGTSITSVTTNGNSTLKLYRGYAYAKPVSGQGETEAIKLVVATNKKDIPVVISDSETTDEAGFGTPGDRYRKIGVVQRLAAKKLARAINCVAAATNSWASVSQGGQIYRSNWIQAEAGNNFQVGTLRLTSPNYNDFSIQFTNLYTAVSTSSASQTKLRVTIGSGEYRSRSFLSSSVSSSTDILTITNHGLQDGDIIRLFDLTGGGLPSPLTSGTPYFVKAITPSQIRIAASLADLDSEDYIDITSVPANQVYALYTEEFSTTRAFPNRLVRSYKNFYETFDSPFAPTDITSDSVIDIPQGNGQQITAMVPFFAESHTKAAQQEQILIVFKEYSIYAVNIETREISRIETNGIGCTKPRSIAHTKHGIMFATDSGIFKLNRSLQVVPIGNRVDRIWREKLSPVAEEDVLIAIHSNSENKWLLAYPDEEESENNKVLVYNHTRENGDDPGSWTIYSGIDVACFGTHYGQTFFGSYDGVVFETRQTGKKEDYRDDDGPIEAEVVFRANDFGILGYRKLLNRFSLAFRGKGGGGDVEVSHAVNLTESFEELDKSTVVDNSIPTSGLADPSEQRVQSIAYAPKIRKAEYHQVRVRQAIVDSGFEIVGLTYLVEAIGHQGVVEARETASKK